MPNLKEYEGLIKDVISEGEGPKKVEAEMVLGALVKAVMKLEGDSVGTVNGFGGGKEEEVLPRLREKVGGLVAARVFELGRPRLIKAILEDSS